MIVYQPANTRFAWGTGWRHTRRMYTQALNQRDRKPAPDRAGGSPDATRLQARI